MKCPKCDTVGKITLYNPENLAYSMDKKEAVNNDYFLETEAYSSAVCWECNHEFNVEGEIIWKIR